MGGIYSIIPTRFARPSLQLRRLYALTFLAGRFACCLVWLQRCNSALPVRIGKKVAFLSAQ